MMKKTNFFYAATIALVSAFGMTSCSVEDNPNPDPIQYVVEQVSLQDIPFYDCEGTFGKDAKKEKTAGFAWVVNETATNGGMIYGDASVNNYADLSEYSKLFIVATTGTPRMMFNRAEANGQWNEDEAQSRLIEYPKADNVWSAKYFSVQDVEGGKLYTVDLAQMVKDKGFAYLHAIKAPWGQDVVVTSMVVEK